MAAASTSARASSCFLSFSLIRRPATTFLHVSSECLLLSALSQRTWKRYPVNTRYVGLCCHYWKHLHCTCQLRCRRFLVPVHVCYCPGLSSLVHAPISQLTRNGEHFVAREAAMGNMTFLTLPDLLPRLHLDDGASRMSLKPPNRADPDYQIYAE